LLREREKNRQKAPRLFAILADPVYEKDDPRVKLPLLQGQRQVESPAPGKIMGQVESGRFRGSSPSIFSGVEGETRLPDVWRGGAEASAALHEPGWPRLVFSGQEAGAILAMVPQQESKQALGFEAARKLAIGPDLALYRWLHFATHGIYWKNDPDRSGLVLSLINEAGEAQEGLLSLRDICRLQLPAELVVLSACQTATGKDMPGEGPLSLARGFLMAGATRVVASLWKVEDRAARELMVRFYAGMLRDGKRPAAALREAQLWLKSQPRWVHPRHWAAFQIQGDWQ
jgi:CHAT domain-containing protein